jgi:hypothetical protein
LLKHSKVVDNVLLLYLKRYKTYLMLSVLVESINSKLSIDPAPANNLLTCPFAPTGAAQDLLHPHLNTSKENL